LRIVIVKNSVLQTKLDTFTGIAVQDMEMFARVNGIASRLNKYDFLLVVFIGLMS